jgi:hypothetical protein
LTWAEVDLKQGVAFIRETGDEDDPKSDAGGHRSRSGRRSGRPPHAGGKRMIVTCAHEVRTAGPHASRKSRHSPARLVPTNLHHRAVLARRPRIRHGLNGIANAVRVRALPGFKSPSLRRRPGVSRV